MVPKFLVRVRAPKERCQWQTKGSPPPTPRPSLSPPILLLLFCCYREEPGSTRGEKEQCVNNGWVLTAKGSGPTARGSKASRSALCFQSKVGVGAAQQKAGIRSKGPRWLRPAPSVVFGAQLLLVSTSLCSGRTGHGGAE